jgi:HK97 family phage prohead protease
MPAKIEKTNDVERRFLARTEVRAAQKDGKPVIEGLGAVFNEYADLGYFVEIIEPGFFDNVLENDVRGLFNHDINMLLGRTSAKTMRVEQTDAGLIYSIDVNDADPQAMSVYAKCQRGDVSQSSFSWITKSTSRGDDIDGDEWYVLGDKVVRRLKKGGCRDLYDTGPVTFPAYEQTSANARSKADEMRKSLPSVGQAPDLQDAAEKARAQARNRVRSRTLEIAEKSI